MANLFLARAGPRAPNPAELLSSERMFTGMMLMREYFTYVIVDSPPIFEVSAMHWPCLLTLTGRFS